MLPLRRVSPAAVPWRLECSHDATTERSRQATCPREEGGSTPAPRAADDGSGAARRDGELAPPVRTSDLRVGDPIATDPLATFTWPELRELIYGGADVR